MADVVSNGPGPSSVPTKYLLIGGAALAGLVLIFLFLRRSQQPVTAPSASSVGTGNPSLDSAAGSPPQFLPVSNSYVSSSTNISDAYNSNSPTTDTTNNMQQNTTYHQPPGPWQGGPAQLAPAPASAGAGTPLPSAFPPPGQGISPWQGGPAQQGGGNGISPWQGGPAQQGPGLQPVPATPPDPTTPESTPPQHWYGSLNPMGTFRNAGGFYISPYAGHGTTPDTTRVTVGVGQTIGSIAARTGWDWRDVVLNNNDILQSAGISPYNADAQTPLPAGLKLIF